VRASVVAFFQAFDASRRLVMRRLFALLTSICVHIYTPRSIIVHCVQIAAVVATLRVAMARALTLGAAIGDVAAATAVPLLAPAVKG
jgi:hypothetical protein